MNAEEERPEAIVAKHFELPPAIEGHRTRIAEALAAPQLGAWPEGDTYVDAHGHGPAKVFRVLKELLHPHLPAMSVAFLWRDELRVRGSRAYASISLAGGRLAFIAEIEAVLEVDWNLWKQLNGTSRLALIDHELHHLTWDSEKERLAIVGHDVEEFGGIVRRWGLWRPSLVTFAEPVSKQLELLPDYLRDGIRTAEGLEREQEASSARIAELEEKVQGITPDATRARLKRNLGKGAPSKPTAGSKRGGKPVRSPKEAPNPFEPDEQGLEPAAAVSEAPVGPA